MSKQTKTNKNTTTAKPAAYGWHGVNCTETPDGVTVSITGKAFENLKKICEIFNKWDNADFTPADMIWQTCFSTNAALMALGESKPTCDKCETLPGGLCDEYREAPDVDDLAAAFRAAGFAV